MDTVRLGRTGLIVNKNGFGALPVQRVGMPDACALLRRAYESGINYFDTARAYTDSEETPIGQIWELRTLEGILHRSDEEPEEDNE